MELGKRASAVLSALLTVVLSGLIVWDIYADWLLDGNPFWSTIAENTVPLALGAGIFLTGTWLYRNRSKGYVETVARWQALGALGTVVLVGWVIGLQIVQGKFKPFIIITQTAIGGAAAGALIGYANARRNETLAEAERERDRSAALFENIPSEAAEIHVSDGTVEVVRVNDTFREAFDPPSDVTSLSSAVGHDEAVHDRIRERVVAGETLESEVTIETEDGKGYYQLRVAPFGEASAYVMYTDVTELRETQTELEGTVTALEASNDRLEQYETIIETAVVGIAQTDPADHSAFNIVNDAFLALFDADSVADLQQIDLKEIYADPERRNEILAQLDETGSVVDEVVEFQTLQGRTFYGSITAKIVGSGDDQSLVTIIFDITDRIEYKRDLEQSNERLEDFAYIASHDLQEPLRTVSRYSEVVMEDYADELDAEGKRHLDTIITAANRMGSMVNGLLDYSRVTNRGGEFEQVDTEAIVTEVRDDLEVLAEEYDGRITVESLPDTSADRDQLWQVFENLIKNALEHSGAEPVTVTVSGTTTGDSSRFTVADDGPGIDPYIEDEIFKIFKSGQNYQTESEARGIGLAVVDRIVSRHDGDIWVESEPGTGARFVFTIPE